MLENKVFGVVSLGCDKNRVDSEKLIAKIKSSGYKLTNEIEEANILIINTCAFLESARRESIETILEFSEYKKANLEKIVVTGCLPEKFIDELFEPLTEADVFLGVNDSEKVFEALEQSYEKNTRQNAVHTGREICSTQRVLTTPEHFAYLKIADGCFNHCTYCLIPKIRGKYRSYPMEELLKEAEGLGDISELILVAQDTTRYGEDLYGKNRLVDLLKGLSALENIRKIRILYAYPDAITSELITEIKTNPKIVKYLDIPFQHSEDRILKLMGRKGSKTEYLALIEKLRREIPSIVIRSTFILGFPSETEDEVNGLKEFLKEAKLMNCGFFAYSKEPDTPAYKLGGHLQKRIKERRVKELYQTQKQISKTLLDGYVGKTVRVLCDGVDYKKKCFVGRHDGFAPDIDGTIYFKAKEATQGEEYPVRITRATPYDLYGITEDYGK